MIVAHDPASKRTLWLDPLAGAVYPEGGAKPIADSGLPPGLVTTTALKEAGAYFWNDFERANDREWLWTWDSSNRRAFGTQLGSTNFVCELDLGSVL